MSALSDSPASGLPGTTMRVTDFFENQEPDTGPTEVPVRRIVLWIVIGLAILAGLALYFVNQRSITPLL